MDNKQNNKGGALKTTGGWGVLSKHLQEKFLQFADTNLNLKEGEGNKFLSITETRLNTKREQVIKINHTQPEKA